MPCITYAGTFFQLHGYRATRLAVDMCCRLSWPFVVKLSQWLPLSDAAFRQLSNSLGPALTFHAIKDTGPFFPLHGYRATRLAVVMSCRLTWPFGVNLVPVVASITRNFSTAFQWSGSSTNLPCIRDAGPFFTLHGYRGTRLAVDMSCRLVWPFGVKLFPVVGSIRCKYGTAFQ
jgi:hypothetical protein